MHGRASYRLWLKEEYRYHTNDFKKTSFSFPFFVVCVCGGGGGVSFYNNGSLWIINEMVVWNSSFMKNVL